MYICPICGHREEEEKSCPVCGVMLVEAEVSPAAETVAVEIVEDMEEDAGFDEELSLPVSKEYKPHPETSPSQPSTTPLGKPSSTAVSPRWVLVIRHKKEVLQEIPLAGELVVGRFSRSTGPVDVDLTGLPGAEFVSRRHMRLFVENGQVFVEDLGSTNGVYVNRVRITQPTPVGPEDRIRVGVLFFRIRPA